MLQHRGNFKSILRAFEQVEQVKQGLRGGLRFASNQPSLQRQRRANPEKPQHLRVKPSLHLSTRVADDTEDSLFYREIDVVVRDGNKRDTRHVRREGWWIPTCLQGRGKVPDLLLNVPIAPILQDYQSGLYGVQKLGKTKWSGPLYQMRLIQDPEDHNENTTLPFDRIRVKPHNMQLHAVTDIPRTIAFLYCPEEEPVRVRIPIRCLNMEKCPGLREGGWLNEVVQYIDVCVAPFTKAPLYAIVDVDGMGLKDRKTVADVQFEGKGSGCRTVLPKDTITTVISKI